MRLNNKIYIITTYTTWTTHNKVQFKQNRDERNKKSAS